MSLWMFEAWTLVAVALAFAGDNLQITAELEGRWRIGAVGRVLFALSLSMLLVLGVDLWRRRYVG